MRIGLKRVVAPLFALALIGTLTACGSGEMPKTPQQHGSSSQSGNDGADAVEKAKELIEDGLGDKDGLAADEGRAFDASKDMVITTVEIAFKSDNARAEWDGSTLVVSMDGSADDISSSLNCSGLEVLIADDEEAIIVFSDGTIVCADRYN